MLVRSLSSVSGHKHLYVAVNLENLAVNLNKVDAPKDLS